VKNDPKREPRGLLAYFSKKFGEEGRKGGLRRAPLNFAGGFSFGEANHPSALSSSLNSFFFKKSSGGKARQALAIPLLWRFVFGEINISARYPPL